MTLIDTHAHIYEAQFQDRATDFINELVEIGVRCVLMPNVDVDSMSNILSMASKYDGFKSMMGLHPTYVKADFEKQLKIIEHAIDQNVVVGIGEIGLDYYWDLAFVDQQKVAFKNQLKWAVARDLPVSIHSRNATQDCIDVVALFEGKVKGVFHCFSGNEAEAQAIIDMGMHLGIGGNITYKSNPVRDFIKHIPISNIVLETDSPYLAPVPMRGKANTPANLPFIQKELARLMGVSDEEVAEHTTRNAMAIFGL